MDTPIAVPATHDYLALRPAIAALIEYWDPSRPAADLIAAINQRREQESDDAIPKNAIRTIKKRGKCMSRRAGQEGSKEYIESGCFKFRLWVDVLGQENRVHASIRICPVKGPGSLTSTERSARKRELIAEYTGKNKEAVESQGGVTFAEQSKIMLEQMRMRHRMPVADGTLVNYERSFRLHLNPVLGDMLVAQIYSRELNLVVRTLVKKGMTASTMAGHIAIAKSVVSSPIDERTSEALYPRVWNAEVIDLPIVDPEEMNTPSFSREIVTGVAAFYSEPRLRTLFTVLAGTGARICEMLGVEIDKHLSSDFRTISIEQQANGRKVSKRLKRPASKREIDLHPDIAVLIKTFVGDRKDGFLFETTTGRPLLSQFVLGKLHCALEALGYVNEQTGTHMAGMHAFRRSRDTYLRNETDCPDGLCKFWLGHARGKDMSERYDKVKRNLKLRRSKAESCGYGFDLPSAVPPVLESGPIDEAA